MTSPNVTQDKSFAPTLQLQTDGTQHEYFQKSDINLPKININTRSKEQDKIAEKNKKFTMLRNSVDHTKKQSGEYQMSDQGKTLAEVARDNFDRQSYLNWKKKQHTDITSKSKKG